MRAVAIGLIAAILAAPAVASADDAPARITVTGNGRVTTPPDMATIDYRIVGEGATSDAAVAALVDKRKAIDAGLAGLVREKSTASAVAVNEVRGHDCSSNYGETRLSTGECAVIGYVASVSMTIRTAMVAKAGTAVGLLGRLGARDPRLGGYALSDDKPAQARAIAAAYADARARAEAVAAGAGVALGRLVSASTGGYGGDIVVSGNRSMDGVPPPPPPPPPRAPIEVDLTPRPIETQAQVTVGYEIAR